MATIPNNPYGFIYRTSLPDGRFYLGQHKIISQKTLDPMYYGSGVIIRDYIKSKGKSQLTREILAFGYSREEMNLLEKQFITEEIMSDPMCINLDLGGRNKYSRYPEVNARIAQSMSLARRNNPDNWPSRKGHLNNKSVRWKLISPSGEEFYIHGGLKSFCEKHKLSIVTLSLAVREGWIPRRGSCAGWQAFNLDSGQGTTRDTLNYGECRKGVNNPYHKSRRIHES